MQPIPVGREKVKMSCSIQQKSLHATCIEIKYLSDLKDRPYVDPTATGTRIGAKAEFPTEDVQNAKEKLR